MFFQKKPDYNKDDLNSVIGACLNQHAGAQRTLIRLFFGFAKGVAMQYSGSKEEAEEILNDSFLKVFSNLQKFDHSKPFKAWLRRIVINTALDHYRKQQRHNHQVDIDEVEVSDFSHDVISKISAEEIMALVQRLPPSYRIGFILFAVEGYSHKEIADMMGIREGTSKSNLRDARRKLQIMMKNDYPHLYLAHAVKNNKFHEN